MRINPIRSAEARGRQQGIDAAIAHLREKADLHEGQVGDARRRGALNSAADELRDGRTPARSTGLEDREPRPLGWTFSEEGRMADV